VYFDISIKGGYFDISIKGKYAIFTLNFEPRCGSSVFTKMIREIREQIGDTLGYDCTYIEREKHWQTHREVGERIGSQVLTFGCFFTGTEKT